MELTVGPKAEEKRDIFFRLLFGRAQGYVCIAFLTTKGGSKKFSEEFYRYPQELPNLLKAIAEAPDKNVYFCPQLLSEKKRTKENVIHTPNVWADLDFCHPDRMLVEPSLTIESSPKRFQAYWILDSEYDPDDVEDLARRIAYKHADQGADRSGWDLTQLLRVPNTVNFKYAGINSTAPVVTILSANRNKYSLDDFAEYPPTPAYAKVDTEMPKLEYVDGKAEQLLQERRLDLSPVVVALFMEAPPTGSSWSEILWRLLMMLFEANFTREEVFIIAQEAKCNKWARDGKPAELLWKEVCRAEGRARLHEKLLVPKPEETISLLSDEERAVVERAPDTFIERYQAWASKLGDAAQQYHQAGAFTALSSILAGSVRLPTSYGMIIPNLWFMILADTTLTRKTTAMDIAMDLIVDVDDNAVMATDGSLEGLLTSIAGRAGKPSIFLRDEFSGLLEQMQKKDFMAGMPELLTKLYDGKMQKRVLRKETIEVRDPRLIIFAGGIKNKVTSLLSYEMVSSGFMPRFVFITAESDLAKVRPIGPPTQRSTGDRDAVLAELRDIADRYDKTTLLRIEKLKADIVSKTVWDAEMADDAWVRYNRLENQMLAIGLKSSRPEIMTPVGDRLSKSILKAALLIAATESKGDNLIISELDILRAIKYGEQWLAHAQEVMSNIGKGTGERQLDTIARAISKHPQGVSRSHIMQSYHLTARDATQIFETLEQRGQIHRRRAGKTEILTTTSQQPDKEVIKR